MLRMPEGAAGRLVSGVLVALGGWAFVKLTDTGDAVSQPWYLHTVTALLAIGLYGSAYGISRGMVRRDVRTVVLAVTVGVLLKVLLISAVMFLFFAEPVSLLLGLAVAQIDPLSVGAMMARSRMSARGKSILLAWASFDDPITALLTVYLSSLLLTGTAPGGGALAYLGNLGLNLLFAGVVLAGWRLALRFKDRLNPRLVKAAALVVLAGLMAFAVWQVLLLGVALIGLFYRPGIAGLLDRTLAAAFYLATFALGMLLVGGVDLGRAAVLGLAAFAAQMVIGGLVIARGLPATDRVRLALGQQNGITAILLALALVPAYPEAVAVIAPAVLIVNILHVVANGLWNRTERTRFPDLTSESSPSPTGRPVS